jgi:hypothetical protein
MIDDPQKEVLPGALRKYLTAREEACLRLLIPKSGTEWLDELIKEAREGSFIEPVTDSVSIPVLGKDKAG